MVPGGSHHVTVEAQIPNDRLVVLSPHRRAGVPLHSWPPWKRGGRSGDDPASHAIPVQRVQRQEPQSPAASGGNTHPPRTLVEP